MCLSKFGSTKICFQKSCALHALQSYGHRTKLSRESSLRNCAIQQWYLISNQLRKGPCMKIVDAGSVTLQNGGKHTLGQKILRPSMTCSKRTKSKSPSLALCAQSVWVWKSQGNLTSVTKLQNFKTHKKLLGDDLKANIAGSYIREKAQESGSKVVLLKNPRGPPTKVLLGGKDHALESLPHACFPRPSKLREFELKRCHTDSSTPKESWNTYWSWTWGRLWRIDWWNWRISFRWRMSSLKLKGMVKLLHVKKH